MIKKERKILLVKSQSVSIDMLILFRMKSVCIYKKFLKKKKNNRKKHIFIYCYNMKGEKFNKKEKKEELESKTREKNEFKKKKRVD